MLTRHSHDILHGEKRKDFTKPRRQGRSEKWHHCSEPVGHEVAAELSTLMGRGGFWRVGTEFSFWAVGFQLSIGHPGSAEKKGTARGMPMNHHLRMAIKAYMPWTALSASPSPAAWVKLLNTSLFLPNFPEDFMQSRAMLMWELSTLSSRGQRSLWAVQAATALQNFQHLLPQPAATQQTCWPQGANLASRF